MNPVVISESRTLGSVITIEGEGGGREVGRVPTKAVTTTSDDEDDDNGDDDDDAMIEEDGSEDRTEEVGS